MAESNDKITTPCPSCGNRTLFIGSGGHLVCSWLKCKEPGVERAIAALPTAADRQELNHLRALLNTPEILDFAGAVVLEAAHQRARWGEEHDATKTDEQFFWLIGYLAGKALHTPIAKDVPQVEAGAIVELEPGQVHAFNAQLSAEEIRNKQLHRIITIAAACANWHRLRLQAGARTSA